MVMRCAETGSALRALYRDLLNEALAALPRSSVRDATSIGSGWGETPRSFREIVGLTFAVDTDEVLLESRTRPLNREYALRSSEWILSGRNDLAAMDALNPRASQFSLDGYTLSGAFGYRLRVRHGDQLERVVNMLGSDPTSRRAIAMIGDANDLAELSPDFPCATSMQFFVRENRLVAILQMRSQSLFGVMPYDLVNFRYIQRFVAFRLGLESGQLIIVCNSAHVYDAEVPRIGQFLESDFEFTDAPALEWGGFRRPSESVVEK